MNSSEATPYRPLGRHLKKLRTRANESLAETSGAVEIDVRELANFELGASKPSEDVLLLLISHFGARDDEAVSLWELAGYAGERIPAARMDNSERSPDVLANSDKRVLFTDTVDIMVNNYGVVMNFMQTGPQGTQPVARVGMSREHAQSVLRVLEDTLSQFQKFKSQRTGSKDPKTP
ncbi:MAG TPA: helix-turn-helix transcriptional regulator [Candidatus Saccharimonadales bacterium]|nr:helix-turn-helix transcriptional regulator [Candidatus Saccharimonadales bacterium]